MKNNYLKNWELSLLLALSLSLCAGTWAQAKSASLSSKLIRLHVIAASDSDAEQEVKLSVRDAVLAYLAPELEGAANAHEARERVNAALPEIEAAARTAAGGRDVSLTLGEEYYPSRDYEGFSLPAGRYVSLRVVLGEGRGRNWWCVVFPPLCLSAAEADEAMSALSEEDAAIIGDDGGVRLKFRLLELWGELMAALGARD